LAGTAIRLLALGTLAPALLTSCGLVFLTGAAAATVVVGAGYVVYEGGKAVVSGTEAVASGVAGAAKSGTRAVGGVVYDGKVFETVCPHDIKIVTTAAGAACHALQFREIYSRGDGLSSEVTARAAGGEEVQIKVEGVGVDQSRVSVRFGLKGDFEKAERIYNEMLGSIAQQPGTY
jgi:hypothetical protein